VREILMKLRDCLESDQEILFGNEHRQGDPMHFWADTTKINGLGWFPRKNIDSGIEEYVSWYQASGEVKYGIGKKTD
jgi:nucleoside-diphosphate-sugar epimerase